MELSREEFQVERLLLREGIGLDEAIFKRTKRSCSDALTGILSCQVLSWGRSLADGLRWFINYSFFY